MNIFDDYPRMTMASADALAANGAAVAEETKEKVEAERDGGGDGRTISLATAIFSQEMAATFFETESEERMVAGAKLVLKVGLGALMAIQSNRFRDFDALVGDFGCERVALKVYAILISPDTKLQSKELFKILSAANKELGDRQGKIKGGKPVATTQQFSRDKIMNVKISQEIAFLFQAYALMVTRMEYTDEAGIDREKTDASKIHSLSPSFPGKYLTTVVGEIQARLSAALVSYFKEEADKISSLDSAEKKLLVEMFQPSMVRTNKGKTVTEKNAKTFVCALYSTKTALVRLRELQVYVVLKKLTHSQESISMLFKSSVKGGPLVPVDEEEQKKLTDACPVVVLEGEGPPIGREEFAKRILEIGIDQLILAETAQELSYGIASVSIEPILNERAVAEIDRFKKLAEKIGCVRGTTPFFQMDHVYCSSVKAEFSARKVVVKAKGVV